VGRELLRDALLMLVWLLPVGSLVSNTLFKPLTFA
jgi:hypothetical protein